MHSRQVYYNYTSLYGGNRVAIYNLSHSFFRCIQQTWSWHLIISQTFVSRKAFIFLRPVLVLMMFDVIGGYFVLLPMAAGRSVASCRVMQGYMYSQSIILSAQWSKSNTYQSNMPLILRSDGRQCHKWLNWWGNRVWLRQHRSDSRCVMVWYVADTRQSSAPPVIRQTPILVVDIVCWCNIRFEYYRFRFIRSQIGAWSSTTSSHIYIASDRIDEKRAYQ